MEYKNLGQVSFVWFLIGAFAELRKATVTFVISVRLFVRIKKQLVSHWTDFHEISYLSVFSRKYVGRIQVSLKSDKNNSGTVHDDIYTFMISR